MNIQDLGRLSKIGSVLVRYGFGHFLAKAGIEGRSEEGVSSRPLGTRLRLAMTELGSTYVKLGQVLSLRPDIVPADVAQELAKLQSDVPAADWEAVQALIERELGTPLSERFSRFEPTPVACASMAQVHFAVLADGTQVAVKVQRPGIKAVIESDLHILYTLAHLLTGQVELPGLYSPLAIVKEFEVAMQQELDFLQEARAAIRFSQHFADEPRISAPTIYPDLSTGRLLIMERAQGTPITEWTHGDERSKELLNLLAEATYRQVFEFGFFHGDPHPGNVWVQDDNRLLFLDFGLTGRLTREMQDTIISLFLGVVFRDAETVALTLYKAGATQGRVDLRNFRREIDRLMMRVHGLSMAELSERSNLVEFVEVAAKFQIQLVAEYAIIARTASMLDGIARELCPDVDIVEMVTPYAQRLVGSRLSPDRISEDLLRVLQHAQVAVQDIPLQLSQLMNDVEGGNLHIQASVNEVNSLEASVRRAGIRIALSVLCASLGISGVLLLSTVPSFLGEQSTVMIAGTILAILSLCMFFGLLLHVAMAARLTPRELRRQLIAVIRFFSRRPG